MARISVGSSVAGKPAPAKEMVVEVAPVKTTADPELGPFIGRGELRSLVANPEGIKFEGEEPDETIILLVRAHLITNLGWAGLTLGFGLTPIILFPALVSLGVMPSVSAGTGLVFLLFWYSITFTYAFINFLYWFFNVHIVTNERIVDVDWRSIIYHKTSATRMTKVQDVSWIRSGVLAGFFDYGTINVQTAAEEENFIFENVPYPELISQKLQELVEVQENRSEGGV